MSDENEMLVELKRMSLMLFEMVSEGKNQKEKILLLSRFGYSPKAIAEIVGTSANTVRVALSTSRKKSKTSRKRKPKDG